MGTAIWDYKKENFLFRRLMPKGVAHIVLDHIWGKEGYTEIFCKGKSYVDIEQMKHLSENFQDENFVEYYKHNHVFVFDLRNRDDILGQAEKINLFYKFY